jgi:hypothetical protein
MIVVSRAAARAQARARLYSGRADIAASTEPLRRDGYAGFRPMPVTILARM